MKKDFKELFKDRLAIWSIWALVFLFIVVLIAPRMFYIVRSGEVGVMYKLFGAGTVTDHLYSEGFHFVAPWNKMYVYNVKIQEIQHNLSVLTKNGLKIKLDLSIRFKPEKELVGVLHQQVGEDYAQKVIIPEVESSLRTTIGQFDEDEVYKTQGAILNKIVNESLEQVVQKFLKIDDVIIRSIELPPSIQAAIEKKIREKELTKAYEFKIEREVKEAERKRIEAEGYKRYNDILNSSLSSNVLKWKGIEATKELAESPNTKVILVGNSEGSLPVILGSDK